MADVIYKQESYKIMGACFEVYKEKGHGFVEPVYQECMEIELRLQGIPFKAQQALPLEYEAPATLYLPMYFSCHFVPFVVYPTTTNHTKIHKTIEAPLPAPFSCPFVVPSS